MNYFFTFFLLVGLTSFAQEKNTIVAPTITIKAPLGQIVTVDDISIEFLEVLEDSRCPTGATCVWEGQAKVKLRVGQTRTDLEEMEIVFNSKYSPKTILRNDVLELQVLKLTPYPSIKDKGKRTYTLLISKR